jgi:hypothetical protein
MSALPSNPFAFKSASLQSSLPQTNVTISASGSTLTNNYSNTILTGSSSNITASLPSAASMFQAFSNGLENNDKNNDNKIDPKNEIKFNSENQNNNNNNNNNNTGFAVSMDNINKISQNHGLFREIRNDDNDNDDDDDDNNGNFDVFRAAQGHIDQNIVLTSFGQLDVNEMVKKQREELEKAKYEALQDKLHSIDNGDIDGNDDDKKNNDDWLDFLNALDHEIEKVENEVKKQEDVEIQNSIALIGKAIEEKTTISLPSQSVESKAFTDHITKLYADFNEKKKQKEAQKQTSLANRKNNINNTIGLKPINPIAQQNGKNKKAANKAMDRFARLDGLGSQTSEQKRRNGNGVHDFLNDEIGPYKKQSQSNKKKAKKLSW